MSENGTTRRRALRNAVIVAAGALGIGSAGKVALDHGNGRETVQTLATGSTQRLTLYGGRVMRAAPDHQAGRHAQLGDRKHARCALSLERHGPRVGDFVSAGFAFDSILELHTFTLSEGTLLGVGNSSHDGGAFAVVGGTGRYAGARGAYNATRDAVEDTLTFDLELTV